MFAHSTNVGGRDRRLRDVVDADRAAVVQRRRHLLDHLGEEPIELRGRDPLPVLLGDLIDEIEQAIDAIAALRGQRRHGRPRQEVERVLGQLAQRRLRALADDEIATC